MRLRCAVFLYDVSLHDMFFRLFYFDQSVVWCYWNYDISSWYMYSFSHFNVLLCIAFYYNFVWNNHLYIGIEAMILWYNNIHFNKRSSTGFAGFAFLTMTTIIKWIIFKIKIRRCGMVAKYCSHFLLNYISILILRNSEMNSLWRKQKTFLTVLRYKVLSKSGFLFGWFSCNSVFTRDNITKSKREFILNKTIKREYCL